MALRLFPQVARSLRTPPLAARSISRTPEQLGLFDWISKKAQPQDVPNVSPHSSASRPKADDPSSAVAGTPPLADEAPASGPSSVSADEQPQDSSAASSSNSVPNSSASPSSPPPSASSSEASTSSSSGSPDAAAPPPNTPVSLDKSVSASPEGFHVTPSQPLDVTEPPSSAEARADVQAYTPPPPPPPPPVTPPGERWLALNETRRAQLFAQNARAGNKYTGRTMHFRPGDISRAIGQVQTIVRTNEIRIELARNEYFEARPQKRWRKKRAFWADYITVGMRENVKAVKILRDRRQLPRR